MAGPGPGMPGMQMPGMHMQQVQQGSMPVPLGPPQGNPQQTQHTGPGQIQQPHPQQPDNRPHDPIARFKTLLPRLKESLVVSVITLARHLIIFSCRPVDL